MSRCQKNLRIFLEAFHSFLSHMSAPSPYQKHFHRLAEYHLWANTKLYNEHIAHVSDADYRKDCGLFFHSIHKTLNHILLADKLWYGRITGQPVHITGLDDELVTDQEQLKQEIFAQAQVVYKRAHSHSHTQQHSHMCTSTYYSHALTSNTKEHGHTLTRTRTVILYTTTNIIIIILIFEYQISLVINLLIVNTLCSNG